MGLKINSSGRHDYSLMLPDTSYTLSRSFNDQCCPLQPQSGWMCAPVHTTTNRNLASLLIQDVLDIQSCYWYMY